MSSSTAGEFAPLGVPPTVPKTTAKRRMLIGTIVGIGALVLLAVVVVYLVQTDSTTTDPEVESKRGDANKIINYFQTGAGKGLTFNRLAQFVDTVGPRVCGSEALDHAVEYIRQGMVNDGLENVHLEPVTIPRWVRGNESAMMLTPRVWPMNILGLGRSIATPPEGITAQVMVVETFDELTARAAEVPGKIVVYNQQCDWDAKPIACYGETVKYRYGASQASQLGAVATLTRSVGAFSINSPHTGSTSYTDGIPKIPAAAITIEDAEMFARMIARGQNVTVHLYMEAMNYADVPSFNVVGEIIGSTLPDEVVLVSGHLDSWDVGQGAMDDGGGMMMSYMALKGILDLGLRPKRTLRTIAWSCEEMGGYGGRKYFETHRANASKFSIVMESDLGVFRPAGMKFTGTPEAKKITQSVMGLLDSIDATHVADGGGGEDISEWNTEEGVPSASPLNDETGDRYFWFHHTRADMMTVLDTDDMDLATANWAVAAYVFADLNEKLPHAAPQTAPTTADSDTRRLRSAL